MAGHPSGCPPQAGTKSAVRVRGDRGTIFLAPDRTTYVTPTTWTTATFASARTAVSIGGLTPGTNYLFQVRAFGKLGTPTGVTPSRASAPGEERCNGRMKGGRLSLSVTAPP